MQYHLFADRMPTAWYNALSRLPTPLQPPLHPAPKAPLGPEDLAPLFPMALIEQEMSGAPEIDIPGAVIDVLRLWRPTPLVRARRPNRRSGRPPASTSRTSRCHRPGSHKPNTAVAQASHNRTDGVRIKQAKG